MSDASANGDTVPEAGATGRLLSGRRRMMLLATGLSILALGAGAWFGLAGRPAASAAGSAAAGASAQAGQGTTATADAGAVLDFKDMVVNIADDAAPGTQGTPPTHFLNVHFEIKYTGGTQAMAVLTLKKPYVRDAIIGYLRQLHVSDLRGSDGLFLLKAELLKRVRAVAGSDAPQEVLITDLVIQ